MYVDMGTLWILLGLSGLGIVLSIRALFHVHTCECGFRTWSCDKAVEHSTMKHVAQSRSKRK